MRVRITDSAALRKISPSQIMAYLCAKGAKQVGKFSDSAAIWALGKEEFLVPVAAEFADYAYRVADILAALERVEARSQLEIMDDLHEVGFDVVGIGRFPKDETSEALGIMRVVDFLAHARDLLMAAACAAATRKACSPAERSTRRGSVHAKRPPGQNGRIRLCGTSLGTSHACAEEYGFDSRAVRTL